MKREIEDYRRTGQRWESAVAAGLGRLSVAEWLKHSRADAALRSGMRGLRGFFLADPEELSLLPVVDQFASAGPPGKDKFYRIEGGNDRLPRSVARGLRGRAILNAVVRHVTQDARGVCVSFEERGTRREIRAGYFVSALPATTLREVRFTPALPDVQRRAIASLHYGNATRMLLQFDRAFWRRPGRPRAFGTDLPVGAVWEGAEEQRVRTKILSLFAGGRASRELRRIVATEGPQGVIERLAWLG